MLASKFQIKVTEIVKSACILHNYIRVHDDVCSTPTYEQEVSATYNDWLSVNPHNPQDKRGLLRTSATV
ncbi:hypothetical protein PR048_016053, partial [Dryococelus australis]